MRTHTANESRPRAPWRRLPRPLLAVALLAYGLLAGAQAAPPTGQVRWQRQAQAVTITRDDWGIAHVHGRTDADAVFGMAYAQAEDDFNRVETNYLNSLGRLAEAEGESAIWSDLRQQLFIDPVELKALYAKSPAWLQALMNGWADGLNYYLATHPDVHPRVIKHFEPWMALSFSEGSIGGDIERVSLEQLAAFYGTDGKQLAGVTTPSSWVEPTGSNGFAIAPKLTADGHALLWINPHTSFFFRSELQMSSDQGLDAYGAVTWGQFFVYQGFNHHIGWMHTSTGADVVDEFAETIVHQGGKLFYRYGKELRPVTTRTIRVAYRAKDGTMATRNFDARFTHHGPIVRAADGKWIATALMNKPLEALEQSWLRTKASDYASYMKVAELKANSSNNTIFADDKGEIAYLHPQFIPRRDNRFDYTKPVDGSDPATDWQGLHKLDEAPHLLNPPNGWIMNTNNWPYSAAGAFSPKQADYPRYMDSFGENPRGIHATRVLDRVRDFSQASLISAAFDSYLPAFSRLVPVLVHDYDTLPDNDPLKPRLAGQVALLRSWDYRWGIASMPTTLAVFWGDMLWDKVHAAAEAEHQSVYDYMAGNAGAKARLGTLAEASDRLEKDFGSWGVPWGEINRFQRNDGAIEQTFDDAKPSIPVPFVSSRWGSLASFGAHRWPGTKKYYGTSGNSFVAVVEFGPKVSARAITAGGESGHPGSKHFNDEAERYTTGNLRTVYFWPEQLKGHTERVYHPGE
ncbi:MULTISPECIES: penicillin acylase family protein [Rhodanobacter]|uniref:penicillin acylase family protein n=1 Tax=Rhodanobacter TaxID=75309 RepID=UPI0004889446|nr:MULTISPECIES: penicillin acylase family protein [Rhodanobacter]UJJ49603.1 penicillin acylase family protein [Rhodanobacter denitrificans]UJM92317.1 penicillin acylase family protein [Rhodanobacter denitrificans]UJM95846.1 penicillin acylase family protein [Rhodanobacter denitrificans]UJN21323.1 penicillin acylase family protein [Rhodanobacter denitrificans]